MKLLETVLCAVERVHCLLARWLSRLFSALWRLQSRIPTPLKFAVGFTGLALVLLWAGHLVSGGYVAQREGDEAFVEGHDAHAGLLQKEAEGGAGSTLSLLILHAEDQLMSAEGFKTIACEFIEVYKKFEAIGK